MGPRPRFPINNTVARFTNFDNKRPKDIATAKIRPKLNTGPVNTETIAQTLTVAKVKIIEKTVISEPDNRPNPLIYNPRNKVKSPHRYIEMMNINQRLEHFIKDQKF